MSKIFELGFGTTENEIQVENLEVKGVLIGLKDH